MSGPVSGMRVLDLSAGMAGAICARLLSDYGAEVVRIEPPGGGPARRAGVGVTWDAGKRSLVADLADAGDIALVRRLAEGADVLIEGLEPGRAEVLGLDYTTLAKAHPALVCCRLRAYGPWESDEVGNNHDFLAAARLGVMSEMPGHRDGPIVPGSPTLAYSTAMMATIAILAATRARLVTGLGDLVEISHEDGFLGQMPMNWRSEQGVSFVASKDRTGALDMGRLRLLLRMYDCKDGLKVQVHTGANGAFSRAMEVFGLADRISPADGPREMASPLTDEDLAILRELPAIFLTRPADDWCELLWANEVACLPVLPPGVVFSDPQIRHAGVMRTIEDPDLGAIEVVGPVVRFSRSPGEVRGPAPRLDADRDDLRARGWRSAGLRDGVAPGALVHPLDGIRIVEVSSFFASPYGDRLLAGLGAEVIKVEPLAGDLIRAMVDPFVGANWGKRGIAYDLKAPETRGITAALLASADVIQNNMRPGADARLGVDYEAARRANPEVIYNFAPGYGSTGPKSMLQAFAPLMGGFTGLMTLFGGPGNDPHIGFGNEDYFNGQLVAISILLALVHRERTGEGQYVEGPQLHSSMLVTSEWFLKDGQPRTGLAQLDQQQTGFGPFNRIYQCLEGWIAVVCMEEVERQALLDTALPAPPEGDSAALEAALMDAFFGLPAENWVGRLRAAGVPCEQVYEDGYYQDYLGHDELVASGRVFEFEHKTAGTVRGPDLMFRAVRYPGVRGRRAPSLGADSRAILAELGLGHRADDLISSGLVISDGARSATRPLTEAGLAS